VSFWKYVPQSEQSGCARLHKGGRTMPWQMLIMVALLVGLLVFGVVG
jgi:hypothetical protein